MIEMIVVTAVVRASEGGAEIERRKKKTVPEGDDGSKRERPMRERPMGERPMGEYRQLAAVR